jgi:hypothetical protein
VQIIKWLAIAVFVLVLVAGVGIALARMGDGPIAIIPGGPLIGGELVTGDEPDWTFARETGEMEFQLVNPPQSRVIWLLVHDKKLFIVSGYMNTAVGKLWKQWPAQAVADGRAVIRIDGKRYERTVTRIVDDPTLISALAAEASRKYGVAMTADMADTGDAWFFSLTPRS